MATEQNTESGLEFGQKDGVLRAITDDGAFRVITVRSTETVRGVIAAQRTPESDMGIVADLVTAAILVRESMAPDLRVQCILQVDEPKLRVVADAHPDGTSRGLVQKADPTQPLSLGENARLLVARTLHDGAVHQGVVEVLADGGVSGALMRYMQLSEQVVTMAAVGCVRKGAEVVAAGGYLVQLLPDAAEGPLMVMTERLEDFRTIEPILAKGQGDPHALLGELLYAMPFTKVGGREIRFQCQCSQARLAAALATLPKHEIQRFVDEGRMLDISCDYCNKPYQFAPEQLRGMLSRS